MLGTRALEITAEGVLAENAEGRQLIPAKYLREATSKQVENGAEGYGYLFWMGKQNTARADGKYCQLSILFREMKDRPIYIIKDIN